MRHPYFRDRDPVRHRSHRTATCPQCRGVMVEDQIELTHSHQGTSVKIRNVPAWVCTDCGKRLVTGEIADRINKLLDEIEGDRQGKRIQ